MQLVSTCLGKWYLEDGLQHSAKVLIYSMPCAVLGVLFATLPISLVHVWASEDLLRALGTNGTGVQQATSLDHYTWTAEFLDGHQHLDSSFCMSFARELFAGIAGGVGFGMVALRAEIAQVSSVRWKVIAAIILEFVVFVFVGMLVQSLYLLSILHLEAEEEIVLRFFVNGVLWALVQVGLYSALFPRSMRLRVFLLFAALFATACVTHGLWRSTLKLYFAMQGTISRICLGVFGPPCLFVMAFESFLPLASLVQRHWGLHSALLMGIIPICFKASMTSVVELGSTSFVSGVFIQLVCTVLELRFICGLAIGNSPIQSGLARLRWLKSFAPRVSAITDWSSTATSITPMDDIAGSVRENVSDKTHAWGEGAIEGAIGDNRAGERHGASHTEVTWSVDDKAPDAAEEASMRRQLLMALAVYSNIVDIIVHVMSAAFYILAMLNPNDSAEPPMPPSRIIGLLFVKLFFELLIVFTFASRNIAEMNSEAVGFDHLQSWHFSPTSAHWDIGVMAIFFAAEAQTFMPMFLCPYSRGEQAISDVANLFEVQQLMAIGSCQ